MYYFLLGLQYEGSDFHGWIKQPKYSTVQGNLDQAIQKVIKKTNFKTLGASKTDAGVHAFDQRVLLTLNFNPNLDYFIKAINSALPETIWIKNAHQVSSNFNMHNVSFKKYVYKINDTGFNLLTNRFELNWKNGLIDLIRLQDIFDVFVGAHDFKLFSGLSEKEIQQNKIKTKRSIDKILVTRINDQVNISFQASGFIRYQIRFIVQCALMIYLNKQNIEKIKLMLTGCGSKMPYKAQAKGLILEEIVFN